MPQINSLCLRTHENRMGYSHHTGDGYELVLFLSRLMIHKQDWMLLTNGYMPVRKSLPWTLFLLRAPPPYPLQQSLAGTHWTSEDCQICSRREILRSPCACALGRS